MKSVVALLLAAGLGAGVYWAFDRVKRPEAASPLPASDPPPAPGVATAPPATPAESAAPPEPRPALVRGPRFAPVMEAEASAPPAPREAEAPREPAAPGPAGPPLAKVVPITTPALEADRALARAAFDAGDRKRGIRLLEDLFQAGKDRPDVDLSQDAARLLTVESKLERKREYLSYLARFDRSGRLLDDQLDRAAKHTSSAEDSLEAATAAWDELTLAYEIAPDRTQRRRAYSQASAFLERMVFSGRHTPLLKSHNVQPGDTLSGIAARFQTTQDSMRRINSLKSDVLQPRQRVRLLPGKLRISVDKSDFILVATLDSRIFLEFPIGIGRDNATPVGNFVIRVRQKEPAWWRPGEPPIPAGDPQNILGSRWLGFQETVDFSGFGIHGTTDPGSLGKESSAGCIRLRNEDIEILYDFVTLGTEVVISS